MLLLLSAVGGTVLSMTYGIDIKPIDDPLVELAETAVKTLAKAGSVGLFIMDLIPIIKYIPEFVPGAEFKKEARIGRKIVENFRERPYLAGIEAMVCTMYPICSLQYLSGLLFRPLVRLDLHSYQWLWETLMKMVIPVILNER